MSADIADTTPVVPVHAPAPVTLKLDLAGGQSPREGFECVDLYAPNATHKWNVLRYPWPLDDSSVAELHCSHFVEHIPMEYVNYAGFSVEMGHPEAKDALIRFFEEAYRVLVPGGSMRVVVPCHRSDRAFWDPTHRRFIPAQTFLYLNDEWRKVNRLDHYRIQCNFAGQTGSIFDPVHSVRHPEAQARLFNESWNTILDWQVELVSLKPGAVEVR